MVTTIIIGYEWTYFKLAEKFASIFNKTRMEGPTTITRTYKSLIK